MPELHPFQEDDSEFFARRRRAMILYEMRLGKTPTALKVNFRLGARTTVIICPKNALYVWRDHIREWVPALCDIRICHGDAIHRQFELQRPRELQYTYYITTYASFIRDIKLYQRYVSIPNTVICDEAKRLRNRKSAAYKHISAYCRPMMINVFMLEGTPTNKGPKDFWTMFNIIDKKRFPSYWQFIDTYYETVGGPFGGTELAQPRNLEQFHILLRQYSRIRYRADVRPDMPEVTRSQIPVEMDDEQEKLYRQLDLSKLAWTDWENLIIAPTSLELSIRLRQILICPRTLDERLGLGTAFNSLVELLEDTETLAERNVVIYCPFKAPFVHWRQELAQRDWPVFELSGGVTPQQQQDQISGFKSHQGIMLCTVRYAEAFTLEPATASYFIGQEWNPNTNRQAEDRLVPQKGSNPIHAFYFTYLNTVEKDIVNHLDAQQRIIDKTMGRKVT